MNINSRNRPHIKAKNAGKEDKVPHDMPASSALETESTTESDLSTSPEIFIGLVSPAGTDLQVVINSLADSFAEFDYETRHIKITDLFPQLAEAVEYPFLKTMKKKNRVKEYIYFGNELRRNYKNDFLAKMAISSIIKERLKVNDNKPSYKKIVYIVDQLKTKEEITLLKKTYKEAFFQISVYSARDIRVDHLSKTMAENDNKRNSNAYRHMAEELVNMDEEENYAHGQKVRKIFQLADVIINVDRGTEQPVLGQVERFVKLLFGCNAYSPNHLEYGMYLAHSAALRSLDLSRQVGAAIFLKTGEIATLGANEVPKAGGGTYWCDGEFDAREYMLSRDSNDARKTELLNEIIEIFQHNSPNIEALKAIVETDKFSAALKNIMPVGEANDDKLSLHKELIEIIKGALALSDERRGQLHETQFMDALEYGRIVHAEMSALSDAARLGIGVQDGKLYCTTFPCHMCSKHIVASGIAEVVFLEPYPKSLTSDLHSDSVKIEGASRGKYRSFPSVLFTPFHGITPTRYREFFYRGKRKKGGTFVEYQNSKPQPMFAPISNPFYVADEGAESDSATSLLTDTKFVIDKTVRTALV